MSVLSTERMRALPRVFIFKLLFVSLLLHSDVFMYHIPQLQSDSIILQQVRMLLS